MEQVNSPPNSNHTVTPTMTASQGQVTASAQQAQAPAATPQAYLQRLPCEILAEIGLQLRDYKDIVNYSKSCIEAKNATFDFAGFWRSKLQLEFDVDFKPPEVTTEQRRAAYKVRMKQKYTPCATTRNPIPGQGLRPQLLGCLALECHTGESDSKGNNMQWLREHCDRNWAFRDCYLNAPGYRSDHSKSAVRVTMLVTLGHFRFEWTPKPEKSIFARSKPMGFAHPASQATVYACPMTHPLFYGEKLLQVDMEILLHIQNFWVRSLFASSSEHATIYATLDPGHWIKGWKQPIRAGSTRPGRRFLGEHTYLETVGEYSDIRQGDELTRPITDVSRTWAVNSCQFAMLEFEYLDAYDDSYWPEVFERELHGCSRSLQGVADAMQAANATQSLAEAHYSESKSCCPGKRGTSANKENIAPDENPFPSISKTADPGPLEFQQFIGTGIHAGVACFLTGWIQPLPAQNGMPGWQRFVMAKIETHHWRTGMEDRIIEPEDLVAPPTKQEIEAALDDPHLYADSVECYEGVIQPGNHMIIGRVFPLPPDHPEIGGHMLGVCSWPVGEPFRPINTSQEDLDYFNQIQQYARTGPFLFWCIDP